ncbi:MAG: alpha/beta fold hydrolase [Bryobacteraceae bacterium]|nr:alpha/beta fold hydrolase [Bryobacteraceae bacterium]
MRPLGLVVSVSIAAAICLSAAEQQFHLLRDLDMGGGRVAECRIGFRTFGELNPEKSNAVLFPTWFGGRTEDLEPLIGPQGLVDPEGLFVIAVDAPGNGISCSPSNASGSFPGITIPGMVESQRRLLTERFGIERLHAVMGISMGGMQTFEWMTAYADRVVRAVPVIGSPRLNANDLLLWNAQLRAIRALEQAGRDPRQAMPAVYAMHQFALETPERRARLPLADAAALLDQTGAPGRHDPRDWAAQLEAMIAHDVARGGPLEAAAARVRSQSLVVVATRDQMVHPAPAEEFARQAGLPVLALTSDCGHRATACEEAYLHRAVRRFLKR